MLRLHLSQHFLRTISDGCPLRESFYRLKEARSKDILVRLKGTIRCYRVRVDFASPLVVTSLVYEVVLQTNIFQPQDHGYLVILCT
jgi:hypothetical protein